MRITKKVREEAIEACLGAHDIASNPSMLGLYSAGEWVGDGPSASLAWDARAAAIEAISDDSVDRFAPYRWLEAAALISDDWNPGDPVECIR